MPQAEPLRARYIEWVSAERKQPGAPRDARSDRAAARAAISTGPRISAALEYVRDAVLVCSVERGVDGAASGARVTGANVAAATAAGAPTPAALVGRQLASVVGEAAAAPLVFACAAALATGQPGEFEAFLGVRTLRGALVPIGDDEVALIARDADGGRERRRTEEALRESEQRLRRIFDGAAVGIMEIDPEDRLVAVNDRFCRMLGYYREELLGRTIHEITAPEDRARTRELNEKVHAGELNLFDYEKRYLSRDGTPLWVHATVSAIHGPDGRFVRAIATIEDIRERRRAEEAFRVAAADRERHRAQLEAVFHAMQDGVVVFDPAGRVVLVNEAEARITGYPSAEAMTRDLDHFATVFELALPDGTPLPSADWPVSRTLRGEMVVNEELLGRRRDTGQSWIFSFSGAPVRDEHGKLVLALVITRDVSDERRSAQALLRANGQLREADRRKDEFLGMLSHELRNPLAPIRNSIFVLTRVDPSSEAARRARSVLERQTDHLTRLVDDLLDVTRIARNKIELQRKAVDLAELVRRSGEDQRSVVVAAGLELSVEAPDAPVWIDADAIRLAQVVGNLVQNAAKFTPPGGRVTLAVRSSARAAELRVRDTGAGIDAALLGRVFEPFVQADQSLARSQGGLGLGLALVKAIVELHGGTVRAESAGPTRGAEFVVTLPLAAGTARAVSAAPDGRPAVRPRRVLVVDDNKDAAHTLAELVELFGHRADVAHDGASALERARACRPDVVLCDIGLPGMSGYEVARALRAAEGGAELRLIAVSGYAQPQDVALARAAGFDGHVAKPADPAEIERLLV